jgi:hypothetical protein
VTAPGSASPRRDGAAARNGEGIGTALAHRRAQGLLLRLRERAQGRDDRPLLQREVGLQEPAQRGARRRQLGAQRGELSRLALDRGGDIAASAASSAGLRPARCGETTRSSSAMCCGSDSAK